MNEIQTQPDDAPELRASDIQPSWSGFGESQAARFGEAFMGGVRGVSRMGDLAVAGGHPEFAPGLEPSEIEALRAMDRAKPPAMLSPDESTARVKQEGLEGRLPHPSSNSDVLALQLADAHEERDREVALARGPNGFIPGALGLITSIGAGMIDPINAAAFAIPVVGEARYGMMLAKAGDSMLARGALKAGVGAAQGAAGGAAVVPGDWWLHTLDGQDYTMADALHSVVMSAGMGATFHAGFGSVGDLLARYRGLPLHGSPEDLVLRGLMHGTHVPATALESEGLPAEAVPGLAPSGGKPQLETGSAPESVPPHPAEILADLPPQAREDTVRAAIADVIAGRPVRAAEMLQEAAKEDPRIAESLGGVEAFHGSPHDFDRFDSSKIGEGEGAQSYGHGLYFAENEAVARDYQKEVIDKAYFDRVNKRLSEIARELDEHRAGEYGKFKDARGYELKEEYDRLLDERAEKKGNLYKVHLAADREHFLDWDKPLSEQPHILAKIKPELRDELEDMLDQAGLAADLEPFSGRELYQLIDKKFEDPKLASEFAREAGIPGIKYLDQGSRTSDAAILERSIADARARIADTEQEMAENKSNPGLLPAYFERRKGDIAELQSRVDRWEAKLAETKKPTHNFVVFDDKLIRITHKNGQEVGLDEMKAESLSPDRRQSTPIAGDYPGDDEHTSAAAGIDNSHDVVSGANSSRDPNGPVYIDRRIPRFSPLLKDRDGKPADLWKYLAIHERKEAEEMARGYDAAHKIATAAERAAVEADGVDWTAYTHEIDGYLSSIEHEKAANPPPDTHVDPQAAIGHHRSENKRAGEKVTAIPAARKAGGPRSRPEATWSLFEFLASRGGLRDDDPLIADLRSSLGGANRFVPGFGNLIRKPRQLSTADRMGGKSAPMSLDQAREAAVEAGYLFDIGHVTGAQAQTTVRTLLDAADEEARGKRVYREGREAPARETDRDQNEHEMESALDHALKQVGIKPSDVAPELRARTIEIMDKEHVTDPVDAYERAVMEETQHGAQAGQHERVAEEIPGWDVPDDAGAAPRAGGPAAAEPEPQVAGARQAPRAPGQADRTPGRTAAGGVKADFKKFADAPHPVEDPDLASASKAAEKTPEPQSTDAGKAVTAAVKAAAEADKLLADILPTLSDDERIKFEDALRNLDLDREANEQIVREGAACLAAAVA